MSETKEVTTQELRQLLSHMLDCGYADIDFIIREFENYDVEFDEIDPDNYDNANLLINAIYEAALNEVGVNSSEHEEYKVSIYTNRLNSHLYIGDEEMYSKADIEEAIGKGEDDGDNEEVTGDEVSLR